MPNSTINNIKEAVSGKRKKYNILTFPTHERYETQLAKTGHDFYAFSAEGQKKWNEDFAPRPSNYYVLPENAIYQAIEYDFILSQSKFGQFHLAQRLNEMLDLPVVSLEHTLPIPQWPEGQAQQMASMVGDYNVFISEFSRDAWGMSADNIDVIHHSVDTETFKPHEVEKSGNVLSVANDFINRDYCLNYSGWKRITEGLDVRVVGDTEGLSKPASSTKELATEYNTASVFLNTSTLSPIPTSLLEAMSCGCAVVSTATCMIPEVIENGKNGFISNDESELRGFIEELLKNPELANKVGNEARKTVVERFSEKVFIDNWNNKFDEVMK